MPRIELSDVGLRSLKAPEKGAVDFWDTKVPSFGCRISQGGTKTFVLKLNNVRQKIGRYPIISLAEARAEAKRILAEKTLGKVRPQSIAFSEALELFLEEKKRSRRPKTVENLKLRLKQHYSFKGQLRDFTHQEVTKKLRKIPTNSEHDHALSVGKTFFNWAYNRRYITDNPIRGISFYGSASRKRILTDHELKNIWDACAEDSLPQSFRAIVKMLILSGLRRTECALIQTSYIRENLLTLPGTITKNGLEHLLPIGPIASAFIASTLEANKRLHNSQPSSPYLFPGKIQGRPFSGWSKAKKSLDKLCGVKAWRLHDLRRTFRTNLGKLGVAPHIAERLVNHISARSDMEQTYDIWTYLPEMRSAMLLYEQHLSALLSGSRTEGFAPDLEKNTSG